MVTLDQGYYRWAKGDTAQLSKDFYAQEFTCPCLHPECQVQIIAQDLVTKLQNARNIFEHGIIVDSGYRCHLHQLDLAAQGYETAVGISQHELGRAADLRPVDSTQFQIMLGCLEGQFIAIGEAKTWCHVDLRADRARHWFYYKR